MQKIYGVKLIKDEKEMDVLCDFFESVGKLNWPYPFEIEVKRRNRNRWLYILERDYDFEEDEELSIAFPSWSP